MRRGAGVPLEPRGIVAQWDARTETLTAWNSTQVPHFVQQGIVHGLGLSPHRVRVIAPDVGGGFGSKGSGYAEDFLVPLVGAAPAAAGEVGGDPARALHRDDARLAIRSTRSGSPPAGTARSWPSATASASTWAPTTCWGIVVPYNTAAHLLGPHRVPSARIEVAGPRDPQDAEHAVPRRGAAGGRVRHGSRARLPGPRAGDGSRRAPPPQLRHGRRDALRRRPPVPGRPPAGLRQRRLPAAAARRRSRRPGTTRSGGSRRRCGGAASSGASGSPATSRARRSGRSRAPPSGSTAPAASWS